MTRTLSMRHGKATVGIMAWTLAILMPIDTQARMKEKMGVFGIPYAIIVEPDGYVVWEGFPLLKGHELTEQVVERILEVGRNRRTAVGNSPEE